MAERGVKGDADTKGEIALSGTPEAQDTIDQMRQSLEELRSSVALLTTRVGEGALEGLQQARQVAGDISEDVTDRANEGVTALRSRIEDQPLASAAIAFFAGAAISGLILLLAGGSGERLQQRPSRRAHARAAGKAPRAGARG
jgi:hypothetical protein